MGAGKPVVARGGRWGGVAILCGETGMVVTAFGARLRWATRAQVPPVHGHLDQLGGPAQRAAAVSGISPGMSYTKKNLNEVDDSAVQFGFSEIGEARFAMKALEAEQTGLAFHKLRPGKRQAFSHRHEDAEEVVVVLRGSGRAKLDDEVVELVALDALRIAPTVERQFEAGDEGLEYLVFGPHHEKDGELNHSGDFWD